MNPKEAEVLQANFQKHAKELQSMSQMIKDEIANHNKIFQGDFGDFGKRTMVRTIFSCIESYNNHLKASALLFTMDRPYLFSESEKNALKSEESFVNDQGEISTREAKITFKTNLKLAFRLFGKSLGKDFKIDLSTPGAGAFLRAIKVRDRITHPKNVTSWHITDGDMDDVKKGWEWYGTQLVEVSRGGIV